MQIRKKVPLLVQDLVSEVMFVGRKRHTVLWGNGIPFLKGHCLKGRFQNHSLPQSGALSKAHTAQLHAQGGREGAHKLGV